jgi:hypothetical protein
MDVNTLHASAADAARGWVEFRCREHGVLVVTTPAASVVCRCGRRAQRTLNGTVLTSRDIERWTSSQTGAEPPANEGVDFRMRRSESLGGLGEGDPLSGDERTKTTRLSDDGTRLIIVERWLDQQMSPPRWRSKNWHRKLPPGDVEYYRQRHDLAAGHGEA